MSQFRHPKYRIAQFNPDYQRSPFWMLWSPPCDFDICEPIVESLLVDGLIEPLQVSWQEEGDLALKIIDGCRRYHAIAHLIRTRQRDRYYHLWTSDSLVPIEFQNARRTLP